MEYKGIYYYQDGDKFIVNEPDELKGEYPLEYVVKSRIEKFKEKERTKVNFRLKSNHELER